MEIVKTALKVIVTSLLVIVSVMVNGAETAGTITNLYINDRGTILFRLSSPTAGAADCDNANDIWQFKIEPSNQYYKEFYSTLLSARVTDENLHVGHGSECGSGYPAVIVKYLYFKK